MTDRRERHPGRDGFPITRLSVIEALRSARQEVRSRAYDHIVAAYWKPVYKYVRMRYRQSVPDAQDFTQGFFTRVLEKDFFASFDPGKARFRTFLRVCLDRYVANEFKSHSRFKRGVTAQFCRSTSTAPNESCDAQAPSRRRLRTTTSNGNGCAR